jgi:hypothetical protein
VIFRSLGFLPVEAAIRLLRSKSLIVVFRFVPPKTYFEVLGKSASRSVSLWLILSIRGLLCFSGVIRTVLFSKSTSVHSIIHASPHLAPVSFRSQTKVPVLNPHEAIR